MDPPQQAPPHAGRRRSREYLLALEEERRKIEVFKRELPLCLELVIQTIDGMKSQIASFGSSSNDEEETVSDDHGEDRMVEAELMPLKPCSLSLSTSGEEVSLRDGAASNNGAGNKKEEAAAETPGWPSPPATSSELKRVTPDWLQTMQLWSHESNQQSSSSPRKAVALNHRKAGGAFQPFEKEKRAELPASSSTTAARSPAAVVDGDSCDDKAASTDDTAGRRNDKEEIEMNEDAKGKGKAAPNRKPRRCWAPELHRRFLQALQQLGGAHVATPKQIRDLMKVEGLTNDEVKSHLQKYRLHNTRRPSTTASATVQSMSAATAAPQFVVVGGIWLPPPEYAAAAAAAAAAQTTTTQVQQLAAGDASGMANTVYAPVATLPSGLQRPQSQQGQRQSTTSKRFNDDGRCCGDSTTESPAVSSSSHTTSA